MARAVPASIRRANFRVDSCVFNRPNRGSVASVDGLVPGGWCRW